MVSRQGSPPNSTSGMVHQFLISDSRTSQPKFANQSVNNYCSESETNAYGLLPSIQSLGERISTSFHLVPGYDRHLLNSLDSRRAQGLSLSLGSHLRHLNHEFMGEARAGAEQIHFSLPTPYVVGNSKYLKPIQCLLQELVNVNDKSFDVSLGKLAGKLLRGMDGQRGVSSEMKAEFYGRGILPPDENELRVKIAKLVALLEELEKRYEKYYRQMEGSVYKFEEAAGEGVALMYTTQALQAVTRHFCCLSDAIVSQINATKRKLKLDGAKSADKESQQSRVLLQHLGFLQGQRNGWRPIRGLPETSVAILRAWLFEHFLHPYPNDPEKLMLASQTGLSKNQVSNWFINARVRLWKPMIEEMYNEEVAVSPEDSNSDPIGTGKDLNRADEM